MSMEQLEFIIEDLKNKNVNLHEKDVQKLKIFLNNFKLNYFLNQFYVIPTKNGIKIQISYFGKIALCQSIGLKKLFSNVIYDKDEFEYIIENGIIKVTKHIQSIKNINLKNIVGAYCYYEFDNGIVSYNNTELMTKEMILNSWKMGNFSEKSYVHNFFADEMAKKVVINRALKRILNTETEFDDIIEIEPFDLNIEKFDKIIENKNEINQDVYSEKNINHIIENKIKEDKQSIDEKQKIEVKQNKEEVDKKIIEKNNIFELNFD